LREILAFKKAAQFYIKSEIKRKYTIVGTVRRDHQESIVKNMTFESRIDAPRNIEILSVERYTGTVRWKSPISIDAITHFRIQLFKVGTNESILDFKLSSKHLSYEFTNLTQGTAYRLLMTSIGHVHGHTTLSIPKVVEFHTRIYNFRRPESCIHVSFE